MEEELKALLEHTALSDDVQSRDFAQDNELVPNSFPQCKCSTPAFTVLEGSTTLLALLRPIRVHCMIYVYSY